MLFTIAKLKLIKNDRFKYKLHAYAEESSDSPCKDYKIYMMTWMPVTTGAVNFMVSNFRRRSKEIIIPLMHMANTHINPVT